jgi:cell division protease FtsH
VKPRQSRAQLTVGFYLATLGIFFALEYLFFSAPRAPEISYSEFVHRVDAGDVQAVVITPEQIHGLLKAEPGGDRTSAESVTPPAKRAPWRFDLQDLRRKLSKARVEIEQAKQRAEAEAQRHFRVTPLENPALLKRLEQHGVDYRGEIESHFFSNLFWNWIVPFAVLSLLWGFLMRRMGRGPSALSLGRSKAKIYEIDPGSRVRFTDVAGIDEAVEETTETVAFLKEPSRYTRLGAKLPKGVLLVGPPGTGKTLLARAVAGEADVPFFSLSGSDFVEMFVGVGAARVRDLFAEAKTRAPCIIFIDELDAIGKSRAAQGPIVGGYDERENTLNQLLVEMDGFDPRAGVVLMGATNRPEVLDRALLRPGRFDRQILVDRPDREGRLAIFRLHSAALPLAPDVKLDEMAAQTAGFVGADIANVCNEAALLATRRDRNQVTMEDLQDAVERVIGGLERKSRIINEHERRIVAYHEAGHALVGHFTPGADPVRKISIVPRGRAALGYTLQAPLEDRYLLSRSELLGRVRTLLGGRAAEELVFGEVSTGASDDLEKASRIVRDMLTIYGMSEQLPNLSLARPEGSGFLEAMQRLEPHSEEVSRALDTEALSIIGSCYEDGKKLLMERREQLELLAGRLLEREKVEDSDLRELLGPRRAS